MNMRISFPDTDPNAFEGILTRGPTPSPSMTPSHSQGLLGNCLRGGPPKRMIVVTLTALLNKILFTKHGQFVEETEEAFLQFLCL